jgi:pyruvate dehydrogenase E1 component alpha subunit
MKTGETRDERAKAELLGYYRQMLLIRRFEEKAAEMYAHGKIGGFLHLYIGEEAVAVGALAALHPDDHVVTHYRDHGYALARGLDPRRVMAELFGKATGVSRGKGGSMHLADVSRRFWGGYAIVGGHLPLAVGLSLAQQYTGSGAIVLCVFGEGATNIGTFHESLNFAALWKLPVLFLCENNLYGMGTAVQRASAETEMYKKACAYEIPGERVDGMSVLEVRDAVQRSAERVRSGQGPFFLEALTYRFPGHSMADPEYYRSKEEVQQWRQRDPIRTFGQWLRDQGVATEGDLQNVAREVERVVEEAVRFAEESPPPASDDLFRDVYVAPPAAVAPAPTATARRA